MLDDNINLTTKELNRLLPRQFGTKLLNGNVRYGDSSYQLPEHILTTLRSNDRRAWLQSFCPTTERERNILCTIGNYNHPERISIHENAGANVRNTVEQLQGIFDSTPDHTLLLKLREDGFVMTSVDDQVYCIDFANHTIINMSACGFDMKRFISGTDRTPIREQAAQNKRQQLPDIGHSFGKVIRQHGGADNDNREWEVGGQVNDEGRSLKR